jgi:hypothetical protein
MKRWFLIFALLVGASFAQQNQNNFPGAGSGSLSGMVAGEPAIGKSATSAVASPAYIDAYALNQANGGTWDMCQSITQAFLALGNLGTVDARGFTGNQGCTAATATGSATNGMFPNANCQLSTQGSGSCNGATIATGKLLLGAVNWYLPVVSTEAGYTGGGAGSKLNYERLGTVIVPQGITIEGSQNTSAAGLGTNTSNIIACQSAGYSGVTNCPAPATTEIYQISSITVTQETAAPGREYMAITTATQSDTVGGQPFRISGAYASGNANMVDFDGSYTACESSAYSDVVTDPSCGGGSGGQSTTGTGTVYAPVNSGITSLTVTAVGSGYGGTPPTCSLPAPTNSGGVQATCIATVSGGSVSGLYVVNRGVGYASGVTAGAVTLSGNATATYQTIPSSCTRGANVDCGYLYGELPLLHAFTPKSGTSSSTNAGAGVSMGIQFKNINIDCKFVPSCVGIAGRSMQEQSVIKDTWVGDSPDRDIDMHGFASQNADAFDGVRITISSLANRQKSVSSGAYTFGSGTLQLTTGSNSFVPNGILYIFGSPANIGCAKSVQTTTLPTYPTYIPLPIISNTGTVVTLDDSGTNCATSGSGTDTYQIGEACEPGKEAIYLGDVGPHGIKDLTMDISSCANTGAFQVAINAALRMNVNSTSSDYFQGGHAEGAMWGVLLGDSGATRGVDFLSWSGVATPGIGGFGNTIQAGGAYQDEQSATAIKIRSEYFTTASGPATTDYVIQNIQRNNANSLYYTINDDNPVNATGTDGAHIQDSVTSLYAVDQVPSCANGSSTQNMLSTASVGSAMGCNMAIGTAKGGNALIFQPLTGGTAVGFTANTVVIFGNYYSQNLTTSMTHFNWNVAVADNSTDDYDLGLYGPCAPGTASCPLLVHLGATAGTSFAPSTGLKGSAVNITPTPITIPPGNYYLAGTCNAGCTATLVTGPTQMELVAANSATASSGGALPAAIAIPAASITSASVPQLGIH